MSTDPTKKKDDHVSTSKALDDEQRVKVLSPGMLVAKRFFRNKLAVAGLVILVAMFLFSFIGGMVSPYNESQVFRKTDHVWKDYAGATYNKSYIFTTANGAEFPAQGQQKFILATNKGNDSFEANDVTYGLEQKGEDYWAIYSSESVATVLTLKGKSTFKQSGNTEITDEMAESTDENGELLYGESHILCNLFSVGAIERMGANPLPYHVAYKKAKYIDKNGDLVEPESPNAYKFEAFLFDAFGEVDEMAVLRVKREEEFAPVKNADSAGVDCPRTARELYKKFYNLD